MRLVSLSLMLALCTSAVPLSTGVAQAAQDTAKKVKKPPSKLGKIAGKLADTAATTAAGAGVQSLLGKKAGGIANALGAGGISPCGAGYGATAGSAIVGAAKGIVKKAADTGQAAAAAPANPCAGAGVIPGMPMGIPGMGIPGMPTAGDAGAAVAGAAIGNALGGAGGAGNPLGAAGAIAGMTPMGLAVGAAPGAIKGIKGMLGGKPQDKLSMVRDLGKGKLELKAVKFIEGTLELEPGFEAGIAAFAEAVPLVEGTYIMHVSAENPREKGTDPDTALARKRVEKIWGLMAASGVSDQKVTALVELPSAMKAGRKLPKAGDVKVEILKSEKQP